MSGYFYDLLDYPWERRYRKWRPDVVRGVRGRVLEAGVGTGRNLAYYDEAVDLVGIDLSSTMLRRAERRAHRARCRVELHEADATDLSALPSDHFDWLISTFLCCVMPDELQPLALEEFGRVLKPGGRFRLVEMVVSAQPAVRRRQQLFAPFVRAVYGARFDRQTLRHLEDAPALEVVSTQFVEADTYLLIEGRRAP